MCSEIRHDPNGKEGKRHQPKWLVKALADHRVPNQCELTTYKPKKSTVPGCWEYASSAFVDLCIQ